MKRFSSPMMFRRGIAVLVALVTLWPSAYAQTFTTFDAPKSIGTIPRAINTRGDVVGSYSTTEYPTHAFLRDRHGTISTFNVQTFDHSWPSYATDINASGKVIGYAVIPASFAPGFIRQADGTIVLLGSPGASMLSAPLIEPAPRSECVEGFAPHAINVLGEIAGSFGNCHEGFLRQRDGTVIFFHIAIDSGYEYIVPQAINQKGQITGYHVDLFGQFPYPIHGFLREPGGRLIRIDVPNSIMTKPEAINDSGQIAGHYQDANFVLHGFLRQPNGCFITFDPSGSINTQVTAINKEGDITGFYATADGVYHGFLRSTRERNRARVPFSNHDVRDDDDECRGSESTNRACHVGDRGLESFDVPGGANAGTFPTDISDVGEIVGYYQDASFVLHGFIRSRH